MDYIKEKLKTLIELADKSIDKEYALSEISNELKKIVYGKCRFCNHSAIEEGLCKECSKECVTCNNQYYCCSCES